MDLAVSWKLCDFVFCDPDKIRKWSVFSWNPDPGSQIPDPESWIPDSRSQILSPQVQAPPSELQKKDFTSHFRSHIPNSRSQLPNPRLKIPNPRSQCTKREYKGASYATKFPLRPHSNMRFFDKICNVRLPSFFPTFFWPVNIIPLAKKNGNKNRTEIFSVFCVASSLMKEMLGSLICFPECFSQFSKERTY